MKHIVHALAHRNLKHIKHPVVKHHARKHAIRHTISGRGTPAVLKGEGVHHRAHHIKPLKFKF